MQLRIDVDRIFAEPMTRQIDRVPAVIHENSAAGNGGVATPVRVRRIDRRAILDPQRFNLKRAQISNRTGSERVRRSANDRRVFPIVDRNDGPA